MESSISGIPMIAAYSLGFMGSAHCISMCGGISSLLAPARTVSQGEIALADLGQISIQPRRTWYTSLVYNAGRVTSYTVAGALVGAGAQAIVANWQELEIALRFLAGSLLIVCGLAIAGATALSTRLEAKGYQIWRRIRAFAAPVVGRPKSSFMLGMMWGWLPCGLVYSTLLWAGVHGASASEAAFLMLVFGLGTLPAMLATGLLAEKIQELSRSNPVRLVAGVCILLYGVWTISGMLWMDGSMHHHHGDVGMQAVSTGSMASE